MTEQPGENYDDAVWAHRVTRERIGVCGCGDPDALIEFVGRVLRFCPLHELWGSGTEYDDDSGTYHLLDQTDPDRFEFFEWMQTVPGMFVIDVLNHADLLEHGGSAAGSWLTDDGTRFLAVLDRLGADVIDEPDKLPRMDRAKKVPNGGGDAPRDAFGEESQ
jgi:hypothetical protein